MDSLQITDDLVVFLTESLAETRLETKSGSSKAPTVYDGYLPEKKNSNRRGEDDTEQEDYPFVIVRFLSEDDNLYKNNTMKFRLLIGVFNEDDRIGWRDVLLVMGRIKFALKEAQVVGIASLTGKIESGLFEEQMKPMWHGVMEVEFETPQVQFERSGLGDAFN